jgi:hypothetical protein
VIISTTRKRHRHDAGVSGSSTRSSTPVPANGACREKKKDALEYQDGGWSCRAAQKRDQAQQASQEMRLGCVRKGPEMTEKRQFCPWGHDTFIFGRDSSYRCLECKRLDSAQARAARQAAEDAERRAEREAARAEYAREREAERQRNLAAGGDAAREQRWQDAFSRREGDICQWQGDTGPHLCMRRLDLDGDLVYCPKHCAQLERQLEKQRRSRVHPV